MIQRIIIIFALSLQALEGLGESQEVKSQSISLSRPDLASDATEYDERGGESISTSGSGSPKDLVGLTGLSLQEKEWISPPDSIGTSCTESSITSNGTSLSDSINDPVVEMMENISLDSSQKKDNGDPNFVPSSESEYDEISHCGHRSSENMEVKHTNEVKSANEETNEHLKTVPSVNDEAVGAPLESSQPSNKVNLDVKFQGKDEVSTLGKIEVDDESHEVPVPSTDTASRIARGKCKIQIEEPSVGFFLILFG